MSAYSSFSPANVLVLLITIMLSVDVYCIFIMVLRCVLCITLFNHSITTSATSKVDTIVIPTSQMRKPMLRVV